ncbi:MAG: Mth938-like domain-containing protein [Phenylobacterium sp.]|uniref:Mth938-like domain-containing protein n=1 Tax=Phenylobacterium sp. TaxID=1871053 RepID=UPI0027343786|nr:Mth938-like domain-containing protein [Phenylobacterium sp.]MDP3175676.1 Mth938-like domain-containing protein [Phenylobacterium sp.]
MARDAPPIDAYGDGGFRVAGVRREGSLLIVGDAAYDWPVRRREDLDVGSLAAVFAAGRAQVEFLLLGMGAANALPTREVRDAVLAAGLGLEFMDTPSAARLYNVLTSEGRRLACALIAV